MTSGTDKFVGYLVSVECKNLFYQGIVTNIDSNKAILQLKNCFQNGIQCGNKLIDIKTTEIENIEILADPQNAYNFLKPKPVLNNNINSDRVAIYESYANENKIDQNGSSGVFSNQNDTVEKKQKNFNSNTNDSNFQTKSSNIIYSNSNTNDSNNNSNTITNNNKNNNNDLLSNPYFISSQPIKVPNSNKQNKNSDFTNINNHYGNSNQSPPTLSPSNNSYHHNNDSHQNMNSQKRKYQGNKGHSYESNYNSHHNGNTYPNGHDSNHHGNNENCFNSISVDSIKDDFDFEKNLALFNKEAFYEEIEGHSKPSSQKNEESLNAFDSIIRQLGLNNNSNSSNNNNLNTIDSNNTNISDRPTQRYHQITLANLFSINTASTQSNPNQTTNDSIIQASQASNRSNSVSNNVNNLNNQHHSYHSNNFTSNKNYRYDEMILDTGEPIDLQQIHVPCTNILKRYVTDDGLIVPCIDLDLRHRLFEQSYKHGFSKQRQIECMSRCCAEMALQLVGGPIRFSPKNNHQKPTILVLANNQEFSGIYAICTARLLAVRNVKVYIFITKSNSSNSNTENNDYFQNELNLFRSIDLPNSSYLNSIEDIKNLNSIDLILNGLDSPGSNSLANSLFLFRNLIKYLETCKASILSIDPSIEGTTIQSKWCIVPVLPMSMSPNCGRVYLCDLGFTKNMFQSVNIKYQSPFGAKFLIPLHND